MSTNNQRKKQSILKQSKSPNRSALQDLDLELNLQSDETKTIRQPPRRVSFAEKYQVKEFCVDSVTLGISNSTELVTITGSDESSYNSTAVDTSNLKLRVGGLDHLLSAKIHNSGGNMDEDDYDEIFCNLTKRKRDLETLGAQGSSENPKRQRNSCEKDEKTEVEDGITEEVKFSSQFILNSLITTISQGTSFDFDQSKKGQRWNDEKENMCTILSTDDEVSNRREEEDKTCHDAAEMEFTECVTGYIEQKPEEAKISAKTPNERRRTICFDEGEDMEFTEVASHLINEKNQPKIVENRPKIVENQPKVDKSRRQTIVFNDGEDMELTEVTSNRINDENQPRIVKNQPQIVENQPKFVENRPKSDKSRRQTIVFNDGEDMDLTEVTSNRINDENQPRIVENRPKSDKSRRQTIVFNDGEDMELTEVTLNKINEENQPKIVENQPKFDKSRRHTIVFNDDEDMELTEVTSNRINDENQPKIVENQPKLDKSRRQTIVFNDGEDMDLTEVTSNQIDEGKQPKIAKNQPKIVEKQPKIVENQPKIVENQPKIVENQPKIDKSRRQTIVFNDGEDMELTQVITNPIKDKNEPTVDKSRRQTIVFNEGEDMEFTEVGCRLPDDAESMKIDEKPHLIPIIGENASQSTDLDGCEDMEFTEVAKNVITIEESMKSIELRLDSGSKIASDDEPSRKNANAAQNSAESSTKFPDSARILDFLMTNEEKVDYPPSKLPEIDGSDTEFWDITRRNFVEEQSVLDCTEQESRAVEELICNETCPLFSESLTQISEPELSRAEMEAQVSMLELVTPQHEQRLQDTKYLSKNVRLSCAKLTQKRETLSKEVLSVLNVPREESINENEATVEERANEGSDLSSDEEDEILNFLSVMEAADAMLDSTIKVQRQLDKMFDSLPAQWELEQMAKLDAEIAEKEKILAEKQKQFERERKEVELLRPLKDRLQIEAESAANEKEKAIAGFEEFKKKVKETHRRAHAEWSSREGDFESHDDTGFCISYFNRSLLLEVLYGERIAAPECLAHLPAFKVASIAFKPNPNKKEKTKLSELCHWLILNGVNRAGFLEKSPTTFEIYKVLMEVSLVVAGARLFVYDLEHVAAKHPLEVDDKTVWINFSHDRAHVMFRLAFNVTPNSYPDAKIEPKIEITIGKPSLEKSILDVLDAVKPSPLYIRKMVAAVESFLDSLI